MSLQLSGGSKLPILIGSILIIVQNAFIAFTNITTMENNEFVLSTFVGISDMEFQYLIDLVGFTLLGIGLIMNDSTKTSGILFLVWTGLRVVWQMILLQNSDGIDLFGGSDLGLDDEILLFFVSSIALTIAIFSLSKASKGSVLVLNLYAIFNLITSFFLFTQIYSVIELNLDLGDVLNDWLGFHGKLILVPILGTIGFVILLASLLKD